MITGSVGGLLYNEKYWHWTIFLWWTNNMIRKRGRIISETKSKYWNRTHKFGIQLPKYTKEAKVIYQANENII